MDARLLSQQALKGKFLDWLLGTNKDVLKVKGVELPSFDVSDPAKFVTNLAEFGFKVIKQLGHFDDLNVDFFKGVLQDVTGVDVNQLIGTDQDLANLKSGNLGEFLSSRVAAFAEPLTSALTGDITSSIVKQLLTEATKKIAAALPPGAGQVTAVLDLLYKGLQFLSDKDNVKQLQELLKSSSAGVREIVDGVVDGKPGGLSQVSHATYNILEKATGPALSFVATYFGLAPIKKELQDILEKKLDLRSYVYVAAYKLAEKAKSFAGFGKLSPAPLGGKVPLGNGQNLWLMKGKDGKVHLVIGDPENEDDPNTKLKAEAREDGTKLDKLLEKERKDLGREAANPQDKSLAEEVKGDQQKVKTQEQVTHAAVEAAEKDVQTSARSGGGSSAIAQAEQQLKSVLGSKIVNYKGSLTHTLRLQDYVGNSAGIHSYLNGLATSLPDTGIIYIILDRRTGEIFKVGQTSTSTFPTRPRRTRVDVRWGQYLSNQRDLRSKYSLNVDSEIVYAFTSDNTGTLLDVPEDALRIRFSESDINKLLWDNTGQRLRDSEDNLIKSGHNPEGLPYKNPSIRINWLERAAAQGYTYQ